MNNLILWLNKNLSSTYNVVQSIRGAMRPGEHWRIVTSHPYNHHAVFSVSDAYEVEPPKLDDESYVAYCLDFVERHRVTLFWPGSRLRAIVAARPRFEAAGCQVLSAAGVDDLWTLDSKPRLYHAIPEGACRLPDYRVATDLEGFDQAYEELRARHEIVCYKPCIGIFGLGFHVISETLSVGPPPTRIRLADARKKLAEREEFRPLILMPYLPGPERSVDCLARDGELLRCVVRLKTGVDNYQKLEECPGLPESVRKLTQLFRLNALFNVQFRDADDIPYLLEINPRMSGGLHYSCVSGVAFPYWAIRLALGTATPDEIPQPAAGFHVAQVLQAIRL
jgi:hypothetical protein